MQLAKYFWLPCLDTNILTCNASVSALRPTTFSFSLCLSAFLCCFLAFSAQSPLGFVTSVFIICLSSGIEVQGLPLTPVSPTGKQATPHLPAKTLQTNKAPETTGRQLTMEEAESEKHLRKEMLMLYCMLFYEMKCSHITCKRHKNTQYEFQEQGRNKRESERGKQRNSERLDESL